MIETVDLTEPKEIMYTEEHIRELLRDIDTDYYERFEFEDTQKMILEDRRLRINYWVSLITKTEKTFKNPNLINKNPKVDRRDIKNPYFTLQRTLPISIHMERTLAAITHGNAANENFDKLHFDYKSKLL